MRRGNSGSNSHRFRIGNAAPRHFCEGVVHSELQMGTGEWLLLSAAGSRRCTWASMIMRVMNSIHHGAWPLLALFALAAPAIATASEAGVLWTPRMSAPAFVEPGGTFVAEVQARTTLPSTGWRAALGTDLGATWTCRVVSAAGGTANLDLGAKSGWRITILAPNDVPPELCRLTIVPPGGAPLVRERAVSVMPRMESSFYVVVLTDDHVYSDQVPDFRPEEQQKSGYHSAELVRLTARVANLAHPRFVLKLGDFATDQKVSRKHAIQQWMIPALGHFQVPTIISAGNHEYDIWSDVAKSVPAEYTYAHWELDFGPRSFVTRLGSFYVLSHEFGNAQIGPRFDPNLLERVTARYRADRDDSSIRFRLVAQHGLDARLGSFFPETVGDTCDLMISGHDHKTVNRRPAPPYHRLAVTTAQEWGRCVWFRFIRHPDGSWSCPQAHDGYGEANTFSLIDDARAADLKLKAAYEKRNDGVEAVSTNVCTVTNELPFVFDDGRVRFLMARGRYTVEGATLLAQYDFEHVGSRRTAVLARVEIPAREHNEGRTVVRVRPATIP